MSRLSTFLLTWLLVFSVVTLSLPIVHIANYGVTLSFVVLLVYLVRLRKFSSNGLIVFFSLTAYFLFNALASIGILDEYEFIKSFGLTLVFLLCYCASFGPGQNLLRLIDVNLFLWVTTFIVVGYEAVQVFELLVAGTTNSWFFLDDYSISTATDIGRFEAVNLLGYYRPVSVYHEPSYLGIVLLMLLSVNNNTINSNSLTLILLVAIAFTVSMVAIIFTLAYLFLLFFRTGKTTVLAVLFSFLCIFGIIWFDRVIEGLRFDEILNEGTSGWVRVMLPFEEAVSILRASYFGNALGQNQVIFDNSLFLFFVYFGVMLPLVLLIWFFALKKSVGLNADLLRYLAFFFGLISLNGAIFTPESTLMLLIVGSTFFGIDSGYSELRRCSYSEDLVPNKKKILEF